MQEQAHVPSFISTFGKNKNVLGFVINEACMRNVPAQLEVSIFLQMLIVLLSIKNKTQNTLLA